MRGRKKLCAATSREEGRHPFIKIRKAIGMKIEIQDTRYQRMQHFDVENVRFVDTSVVVDCMVDIYQRDNDT